MSPPRGYEDRRGPPPPPQREFPGRRRSRSRSPQYGRRSPSPYGRNRSPPHFKRRRDEPYYPEERFDRRAYDDRRGFDDRRGYEDPYYREEYREERRPPSPGPEQLGPKTFKQFLLEQPDDPSPEEAKARYQGYLVEFHGGVIKAEFEQVKNNEEVRAMFDPREFEKALAKRNEDARDSATKFHADAAAGKVDPASTAFNQGMFELAPKLPEAGKGDTAMAEADASKEEVIFAPPVTWKPERIAHDTVLARRLTRKLDFEKGITENALLPTAEAQEGGAAASEGNTEGEGTRRYVEVAEPEVTVGEADYDEAVGRLDVLLTYLWRVHGIDYYAGYELAHTEYVQRLTASRMLRGAKPAEGEAAADPEEEARLVEAVHKTVDECWGTRIKEGDPLEARCARQRVEQEVEKWIEDQVICHADNKWGNKLSTKLFMGRKFVIKHIRTKHEEKVQAQRDQIYEAIFFENFKVYKEEEAKAVEAEAQAQAQAQAQPAQGEQPAPQEGEEQPAAGGFEGGMGAAGGRGRGRGMRGRGGMMMGGRGGRGFPFPAGMVPEMPMIPLPMAGAMPAPMIIPAAGGAPMMMPMPMMLPGLPMMPGMMGMGGRGGRGGRGGPGGRGRGMPGRGGFMMGGGGRMDPGGMREYYDLDNPQNNRAVLDYGDL